MRLLHISPQGRLVLTDFRNKVLPPYAILSHRWGDGEVLFNEIGSGACEDKEGYRKLKFCAEQAALDKLQYFWVDTCCIDKWNLSELSKSINSMFRWYRDAARCYVFLSDVSAPSASGTLPRSDWETSFRASTWFTRGWTLQELVAPVSVEFFSREGRRVGDKLSLDTLIHDITSIPLAALRNGSLSDFTTAERMQWAENRQTTEDEDLVYCLLGLLGVSIPVSYGEGRQSALQRLRAEIEAANAAPSLIPFAQNDRFVGHESQLTELEAKLFGGDGATAALAIAGPGGTGKTQLALELAHRTRRKNRDCSVFWIDASSKESLHQSYTRIFEKLKIAGWDDAQADHEQLIKRCLARLSAMPCLLVFDNTEDTILKPSGPLSAKVAILMDYLPQSEQCSVVFTTTQHHIGRTLAPHGVIELQRLSLDTAQQMLESHLKGPLSSTEQHEAKLLLNELSYLPLAIIQAAACINETQVAVQEYRSQLAEYKEKLQEGGRHDPVALTLLFSVDRIRGDHAHAVDYLFLAACVDRKDIPLDLLEASLSRVKEDAVKVLSRYALITRRPAESALDLHRLVKDALQEWLYKQGRLCKWTHVALRQLLRVFPYRDHSNRSKWRRLLPHAECILACRTIKENNRDRLSLIMVYADALASDGRYAEAEQLLIPAIKARKRVLGDEHPSTLTSINNLAFTYGN